MKQMRRRGREIENEKLCEFLMLCCFIILLRFFAQFFFPFLSLFHSAVQSPSNEVKKHRVFNAAILARAVNSGKYCSIASRAAIRKYAFSFHYCRSSQFSRLAKWNVFGFFSLLKKTKMVPRKHLKMINEPCYLAQCAWTGIIQAKKRKQSNIYYVVSGEKRKILFALHIFFAEKIYIHFRVLNTERIVLDGNRRCKG